jgi:cobalt-zinc-cadmium efflux system membrane fusion protein
MWVLANVFEADISKIKEGQAARVTTLAYPDKVFNGKIDKVSEVLDPSNKALRVRVKIDNPQMLLKPEMFYQCNSYKHRKQKRLYACHPQR